MRRKILLITAYFYPQNAMATIRVGQWAKYLSRLGYDVTVITTKKYFFNEPLNLQDPLEEVRTIEVEYLPKTLINIISKPSKERRSLHENSIKKKLILREYMKSIRSYFGSLIDVYNLWIKPAYKIAAKILSQDRYVAIISSYNPPASHIIASKLKRKYSYIKWIADFRDLWAYNHIYSAKGILGLYEKYKEKRTLSYADYIVTVSDPLTDLMKKIYLQKNAITIENGFDPEEFPNWESNIINKPKVGENIRIVYTGTIYEGKRDPTPLIQACNDLIDAKVIKPNQISVEFYGQNQMELSKILSEGNLNKHGFVKIKGIVNRDKSLKAQREADLLLFLEWNDPSARGVLTGKLFEYIVSGTPILAVGITGKTSAGMLIEKTGTGVCLLKKGDIKKVITSIVKSKYVDFYNPDIEEIRKYSRDKQVKRLVEYVKI